MASLKEVEKVADDLEQLGEFRACVERLEREIDTAAIVCTGPWAPYGFTDAQAASG